MYAIYSQPRPGRPRLAVLTAVGILLVTVLLALAVIHTKRSRQRITLDEPQLLPAGQMKCRLPAGWKIETQRQPPGIIAEAAEPDGGPRRLIIFRGLPRRVGIPSEVAPMAVAELLAPNQPEFALGDPSRIGPLPAWDVEVLRSRTAFGMARVALAPDGGVFGVLAFSLGGQFGSTRLLDEICAGIEFADIVRVEGNAAMNSAGVHFSAPGGATFFRDPAPLLARVRMTGGEGPETWYLDACRVPIIRGRTPAALVTDQALSLLQRPDLPQDLEKLSAGQREYVQTALIVEEEKSPSVLLACAQTAPDTALMLVGRCEPGAADTLRGICQTIVREAKVTPYSETVKVAAAEANAREILKDLAKGELNRAWEPLRRTGQSFLWHSPGYTLAREARSYRESRADDGLWWKVHVQMRFEVGAIISRELDDRWLVKDDGSGHQCNSQVTGRSVAIGYMEQRRPGSHEVRRELKASGSVRKLTTPVDDTYACEPILLQAAGRLTRSAEASPAVFNTTETFPQAAVYWIILPAGQQPVPGKKGVTASAVLVQRDYDPDPTMLFYADGEPVGMSNDGNSWQTLAADDESEPDGSEPAERPPL
jgi:hypothetical protein